MYHLLYLEDQRSLKIYNKYIIQKTTGIVEASFLVRPRGHCKCFSEVRKSTKLVKKFEVRKSTKLVKKFKGYGNNISFSPCCPMGADVLSYSENALFPPSYKWGSCVASTMQP